MMEYWQENDSPLGPSVHGGAIPGNLGGKAAEPIFRAQGLDEALGTSGSLYAESIGAKNIVIFATQVEGFQLAADAAEKAAADTGPQGPGAHRRPGRAALLPGRGPEDRRAEAGRRHRPGGIGGVRHADQAGGRGRPVAQLDRRDRVEPGGVHRDAGHRADRLAEGDRLRRLLAQHDDPGVGLLPAAAGRQDRVQTRPTGADNPYAFSTYDLLVQTALAVEAGGSYKASDWAPAMFKVGDPPGDVCYTYADCLSPDPRGQGHRLRGRHRPRHVHRRRRQRRHPVVHAVRRGREGRRARAPRCPEGAGDHRPDQDRRRSATRRTRPTSASGNGRDPPDRSLKGPPAIRRRAPFPGEADQHDGPGLTPGPSCVAGRRGPGGSRPDLDRGCPDAYSR